MTVRIRRITTIPRVGGGAVGILVGIRATIRSGVALLSVRLRITIALAVGLGSLSIVALTIRLRGRISIALAIGLRLLGSRSLTTVGGTRKNFAFVHAATILIEGLSRQFVAILIDQHLTVNVASASVVGLDGLSLAGLGDLAIDSIGGHASDS